MIITYNLIFYSFLSELGFFPEMSFCSTQRCTVSMSRGLNPSADMPHSPPPSDELTSANRKRFPGSLHSIISFIYFCQQR